MATCFHAFQITGWHEVRAGMDSTNLDHGAIILSRNPK